MRLLEIDQILKSDSLVLVSEVNCVVTLMKDDVGFEITCTNRAQ